jgi:hypothetical protein
MWDAAGQEWSALGREMGTAATGLEKGAHHPVKNGAWTGSPSAATALKRIQAVIDALEAAQGEMTAVATVLAGLGRATEMAQQTLREAKEYATSKGLFVGADGTVSTGSGFHVVPQHDGSLLTALLEQQVAKAIGEALREATQADQKTAAELRKLAGHTGESNLERAYNIDVGEASRTMLEAITGAIPTGPPELVAKWWAGLDPAEQERIKLAAPATLAGLAGIPEGVKADLRGYDGIDRTKLIQYALKHWNNPSGRTYPDDCTNFVSQGLREAGLHQKGANLAPFGAGDTKHKWFGGAFGNGDKVTPRSHSFTLARGLHEFLVNNKSSEVPLTQARPGDVMFWQSPQQGIHHTAVVTAVVDGHVFYTQHSGGAQNASWNDRQIMYNQQGNPQQAIVVRVRQD